MNELEKLESFDTFRKESIDLLDEAKIDKEDFIDLNLNYINKLNLKPFTEIKSIKEAIYNYQYYNLLAKKANNEAKKYHGIAKKKKLYNKLINDRENYYHLKDKATLRLLEIIEYRNVESYYIELKSKRLKNEIFEINIRDIDKAIFHSKSKVILEKLKENEVFTCEKRASIIDSYVNKSY